MADGITLGQAYVQIMPSTRGIKSNLTNAISPAAESAGAVGGTKSGLAMVKGMMTAIAAVGVGKMIGDAIFAGGELEQAMGGAEAVFGDYYGDIMGYAEDAYKTMGMSQNSYLASANKMSSLLQGSGLSQKEAMDLTTESMQRAADVASVMGISTESAMEAINGAAKGNFTMMDNLGVAMNATTLQAYALEKGMNFDWNTATNAEKTQLALEMFMDKTSQYAGNFSRESEETITGSIGMMKSAWSDLIANMALGNDLTPYFKNLFDSIIAAAKNIIPAIWNVMKGIPLAIWNNRGEIVAKIDALLASAWDAIIAASPTIVEKVREIFVSVINYIVSNGPQIAMKILEICANIVGIIASLLSQILAGLIKGATDIGSKVLSVITTKINEIKAKIVNWASGVISSVRAKFSEVISAITSPFTTAVEKVRGIIDKIKGFFPINIGNILKNIKLPHFKLSWGEKDFGPLGSIKYPKGFKVEWYAKGGIFNQPTIAGIGEAGAEAVIPLDPFWKKLDQLAGAGDITINVYAREGMDVNDLAAAVERRIIETQKRRSYAWR